jgi:hypothetical protein
MVTWWVALFRSHGSEVDSMESVRLLLLFGTGIITSLVCLFVDADRSLSTLLVLQLCSHMHVPQL